MERADLRSRARRAYELGRLRDALGWALVAIPLAALSHTCCLEASWLWSISIATFAIVLGAVWYGRAVGAGARAGLLAGLASWALPVLSWTLGLVPSTLMLTLCFAGGLASGVLVGRQLRGREAAWAPFLISAATVTGLIGALGCTLAGLGGVIGMIAGQLLGAAPIVARMAFARAR